MSKPPFLKVVGNKGDESTTPPEPPKTPEYVAEALRAATEKLIAHGVLTWFLGGEDYADAFIPEAFPNTYNMHLGYQGRLNSYMKGDDGMIIEFED